MTVWTTPTSSGLRNVHDRDLLAPPERVWLLMAELGGACDELWPSDRWPAMELDRGLRVGSRGGHGPIRYRVAAVESGVSVRFAFEAESGLDGWHELSVTAHGSGSRLTHTLVLDHPSVMVSRVVLPLHDAVIEDLLDQAEAAVAGVPVMRRPLSPGVRLRVAMIDAVEPPARLEFSSGRRVVQGVTVGALLSVAGLHALWAGRRTWPVRDEESLARNVLGTVDADRLPGPIACLTVAGALGVAAGAVASANSERDGLRAGARGINRVAASALGVRGVVSAARSLVRPSAVTPEFRRLDLLAYSPLCVGLAVAIRRLYRP